MLKKKKRQNHQDSKLYSRKPNWYILAPCTFLLPKVNNTSGTCYNMDQFRRRDSGKRKQDKIKDVGAPFPTYSPRPDMDAWKLAVLRTQERTGQIRVSSQLKLPHPPAPWDFNEVGRTRVSPTADTTSLKAAEPDEVCLLLDPTLSLTDHHSIWTSCKWLETESLLSLCCEVWATRLITREAWAALGNHHSQSPLEPGFSWQQ